jgi:hypothetical protein
VTGIGARAGFGYPVHCQMLRHGWPIDPAHGALYGAIVHTVQGFLALIEVHSKAGDHSSHSRDLWPP